MTTKKPSTESQPQPNLQKSGASGGTVILGESWFHHIKKVRAAQAAKKDQISRGWRVPSLHQLSGRPLASVRVGTLAR